MKTSRVCSLMNEKPYFLCADGVLVRNGKFLLLKRNVEPFRGFWGLVGGHVQDNESAKDALKREFKEETNLDVEVDNLIDARFEETFDRVKVILTYGVKCAKGEVKTNHESECHGWFSEMPANSVYDYSRFLFRK